MKKNNLTWKIILILMLVIVGAFNTIFIRPEDVGSWKNYVGYAFIISAIVLIISIFFGRNKKNT